jgi:hypothetical protein
VLLNEEADRYMLVYYHNRDIPEQVKNQNRGIEGKIRAGNIQFRTIPKDDLKEPYYALFYGNRLFNQFTDHKALENLTTSPVRRKTADELMRGKLSVMLFLKSGDADKDQRGLQVLKNTVARSPFGSIIPVIELDRNSIEEKHFVSMLLNVESDLKNIREPMLFGVFGRFRTLEPLLGKGISEENINLMIDFLTADCSCLIKDNLPGVSILFDGKWENPQPALVNKIIDDNPLLGHH